METDVQRIGGRYKLERKMGFGSFGEVFLAHDFESLSARQLFLEHECIPRVCWFGTEGGSNVTIIDCLGQSLQELFVRCHFKFSVQTIQFLASQLVGCLKHIHSCNFIHRDIKPSNIVIGTEPQANVVYIINFGLSKQYRDPSTYEHISPNTGLGLIGMATFASINSHLGLKLGRRDDMESLAYTLIYFLHGSFQIFLKYCRSLSFEDKPDYQYINNLFMEGFQNDTILHQGLCSEKRQCEH
ncbi:kinase-like domain-containing protein [Lactarius quietus]|nr:kinase-like domain-containing protein [Lactarius quietus]KAF8269207.1 kinase-like domain-containing protein [Lactarius quietus]